MAIASVAARTGRVKVPAEANASRPVASSITTKRHFWVFFEDPVHRAAWRIASTSASGIGSGRKLR